MPKDATAAFEALMADQERRVITLFVWRFVSTMVIRTTDYDQSVEVDVGDGDGLQDYMVLPCERQPIEARADLQIEDTTLVLPNADVIIEGATPEPGNSIAMMAAAGLFDDCEVTIYLHDLEGGNTLHHSDWIVQGAIDIARTHVTIHLQSELSRLTILEPRTVVQEQCNNCVYDAACGLDRDAWTQTGVVTGGTKAVLQTNLTQADAYHDLGEIQFTTGDNWGAVRTVMKYVQASGAITLSSPLRKTPAAGDQFTIVPGCDRTIATCREKFFNLGRFRGFPFVPRPETVL
ncbi:MAG: DUF2163 domain-containing protein [bacterium]